MGARNHLAAIVNQLTEQELAGEPPEEVSASVIVQPRTVKAWLRAVTRDGFVPMLAKWEARREPRPRQLDADPVAFREPGAKEKNPRIRKRVLALAYVA